MSHGHTITGLGEDVADLQHARRATRRHDPAFRPANGITLLGTDPFGDIVVLQIEAAAHATALIGTRHLREAITICRLNQNARLDVNAQGLLQMTRVMVSHRHRRRNTPCLLHIGNNVPTYQKLTNI